VEAEWSAVSFDMQAFPSIAAAALTELPPAGSIDIHAICEWLSRREELPVQYDPSSAFGQPALTIAWGTNKRFFVDVYLWMDTIASIHNHPFAGAFAMIAGESIHKSFEFVEQDRVSSSFRIGRLLSRQLEILRPGDARPFSVPDALIHSLLHVDPLSISCVVRTPHEQSHTYWSYFPPTIAAEVRRNSRAIGGIPILLHRRMQTLRLLGTLRSPAYSSLLADVLASSDLESVFYILLEAEDNEFTRRQAATLWETCARRFGARFDAVASAIGEQVARNRLETAHTSVLDGKGRFWNDALLSADTPQDLSSLVKQKYSNVQSCSQALATWFVRERFKLGDQWLDSEEMAARVLALWLAGSDQDAILKNPAVEPAGSSGPEFSATVANAISSFQESPMLMRARSLLGRAACPSPTSIS